MARSIGIFKLKDLVAGETAITLVIRIPFTMLFNEFSLLAKSTFYFKRLHLISPKNGDYIQPSTDWIHDQNKLLYSRHSADMSIIF